MSGRDSSLGRMRVGGESGVEVFKKPLHPPPRRKRKVLDEETYVKEIEKIIERDFFPDLENLRDRLEFLAARDSQDLVRLRQWYARQARALAMGQTNSVMNSPATFETPQAGPDGSNTPRLDGSDTPKRGYTWDTASTIGDSEDDGGEMSLDVFMSCHTSEDNKSFENLMAETQARFRRKYAWMFEAEEQHNKEYLTDLSLPPLLPPASSQPLPALCPATPSSTDSVPTTASSTSSHSTTASSTSSHSALSTSSHSTTALSTSSHSTTASSTSSHSASSTSSTTATTVPTAVSSSESRENSDPRPGHLDNWRFHTFSSVMFVPDGILPTNQKMIDLAKKKQRQVELSNTRFHGNPFTETMSAAAMLEASAIQASKKEGKVGVDGKELGKDTPRVNGYNFVAAPSPAPGVDASPLMTWGEVEGTPCQLDGTTTPLIRRHTPGTSYRIPQLPSRDRLGHRLAEEARQKHRHKKSRTLQTKHNLSSTSGRMLRQDRGTGMSPAARKLLTARLGVKHTDSALRASYTPSPSTRNTSSPFTRYTPSPSTPITPHSVTPVSAHHTLGRTITPKISSVSKKVRGRGETEGLTGLTDNLLDLPRRTATTSDNSDNSPTADSANSASRKCAADFF